MDALCRHRFGDRVSVDEVIAGPEAAKGTEFVVTLALSDRTVPGAQLKALAFGWLGLAPPAAWAPRNGILTHFTQFSKPRSPSRCILKRFRPL